MLDEICSRLPGFHSALTRRKSLVASHIYPSRSTNAIQVHGVYFRNEAVSEIEGNLSLAELDKSRNLLSYLGVTSEHFALSEHLRLLFLAVLKSAGCH